MREHFEEDMNAKKQRDKNHRRARKFAEQSWEAADEDNFDLALKIIHRAIELHPLNPMLWNDQGMLLLQLQEDDQAAASFQTAIHLAPDFAEAYASLASIRARQGSAEQAVALQREAVRHSPASERAQYALAAYEALLLGACNANTHADFESRTGPNNGLGELATSDELSLLKVRVEKQNWPEIDETLTRRGVALISNLLNAQECETLRTMFDDDQLFAKTVTMNKSRFGQGVYRYLSAPLPPLVDAIRQHVYASVANIANRWQVLLRDDKRFPPTWSEFNRRCADAGQSTPSPLMLRYESGGFNAPHQDLRGEVFFPLQLVVVLSPRAGTGTSDPQAFTGGEFLFCNQPERKPSDRCAISAGLGDAVIFCTRTRLVRVGDLYGLKPVKHGLDRVASGIRYAIGIPFHEFE